MIRDTLSKQVDHDPHFRWRGESVTRIENLSDIVFALTLGMIVSAAEPPRTFNDLEAFLISIVPVAASFTLLLGIWQDHFNFFRRYGLADGRIIFLNGCLLLVVLYAAYPLRFAFDSFFAFVFMMFGDVSRAEEMGLSYKRAGIILGYFAFGYFVIQLLFGRMYAYAVRKKDVLELNDVEVRMTKASAGVNYGVGFLSLLVGILAMFTPLGGFSGFILFFSFPLTAIVNARYKVPKQTN